MRNKIYDKIVDIFMKITCLLWLHIIPIFITLSLGVYIWFCDIPIWICLMFDCACVCFAKIFIKRKN